MKQGTAFEFCGMSFGPKPDGWDDFAAYQSAVSVDVWATSCLGVFQVVVIPLTVRERELLDEGILRHSATKLRDALALFKPLDALDILRAAQ